jgi:hypothetical protein
MQKNLIVLTLFLVIYNASALKLVEKVEIDESGTLAATTSGAGTGDNLNAGGKQSYFRSLSLEEKNSLLVSKYKLSDPQKEIIKSSFKIKENGVFVPQEYEYNPNSYSITMVDMNYLKHSLSVSDSDALESNSNISFSEGVAKTNFNISGSGNARESLTGLELGGGRPETFASLSLKSNSFSLLSSAESDSYLEWDVNQSGKLEEIIPGSASTGLVNFDKGFENVLLGSTDNPDSGNNGAGSKPKAETKTNKASSKGVSCDSESNTCDTQSGDGSGDEAAPSEEHLPANSDSSNDASDENASEVTQVIFPEPADSQSQSSESIIYEGLIYTKPPGVTNYYRNISANGETTVMSGTCREAGGNQICKKTVHISYKRPNENAALIADLEPEYWIAPTR